MTRASKPVSIWIPILLIAFGAGWTTADQSAAGQATVRYGKTRMAHDTLAVEMTLGLSDHEPVDWSGKFKLPARQVLEIRGAEASGNKGWRAGSLEDAGTVEPVRLVATLALTSQTAGRGFHCAR